MPSKFPIVATQPRGRSVCRRGSVKTSMRAVWGREYNIASMHALALVLAILATVAPGRPRARDLGITPGNLPPGPLNAITDVAGVRVGQTTVIRGENVR